MEWKKGLGDFRNPTHPLLFEILIALLCHIHITSFCVIFLKFMQIYSKQIESWYYFPYLLSIFSQLYFNKFAVVRKSNIKNNTIKYVNIFGKTNTTLSA